MPLLAVMALIFVGCFAQFGLRKLDDQRHLRAGSSMQRRLSIFPFNFSSSTTTESWTFWVPGLSVLDSGHSSRVLLILE